MCDSSDSEIIQRKRQNIKKQTRYSEESDSYQIYDSSEVLEGDFEPLFHEIFGSGDEYAYIYNKKEDDSESEEVSPQRRISTPECYKYVTETTRGFRKHFQSIDEDLVSSLIEGYSPEYLAFHCEKMTVKELYFIKDLIAEFKERKNEKDTTNRETKIPGLLTMQEYEQNIKNFDTLFTPDEKISLPFGIGTDANTSTANNNEDDGWALDEPVGLSNYPRELSDSDAELLEKYFKRTIAQIAANPDFIKRVYKSIVVETVEPEETETSVHSLAFLQKLYSNGNDDLDDQVRKLIIKKAYELVRIDREALERRLIESGIIEGAGGLQELADLIISLRGRAGNYAGVYLDKGLLTVVKIDDAGNFIESAVFKEHETVELREYLSEIDNVCVTSTSPSIKFLFWNLGITLFYVPRGLSFFNDYMELSIPYNIAALVQNPVLYFSKLHHHLINRYPVMNYKGNDTAIIEKAVSIACATHRLDWKYALSHKFGFALFNLLKIDISESRFNFERLDTLESLKEVFDYVQYSNICCFFNLLSSQNPLDRTLVHPVNYSTVSVLFRGAYQSLLDNKNDAVMKEMPFNILEDEDKIIEMFVNQPEILESYNTGGNSGDADFALLSTLKSIILRPDEIYFSGAPDESIFQDVVPSLSVGNVYTGSVVKIGGESYLCNVSNATVFLKKTVELSLNQIIKIEIVSKNTASLGYIGSLAMESHSSLDKFRTHPLFRNLISEEVENYMKNKNMSIVIRPSATPKCCTVVCRITDDLFFSYRLQEVFDASENFVIRYQHKENNYTSIDSFIDDYIRKVYQNVKEISSFKYYFKTVDEAYEHLQSEGEFTKYSLILSRENPTYIEFILIGKKIFAKIDGDRIFLRDKPFPSINDFVFFVKANLKNL